MAVLVPIRYGVEGYDMGVVIFHLASHPARCLWPSTASAGDAFSASLSKSQTVGSSSPLGEGCRFAAGCVALYNRQVVKYIILE